jgi:hypothetical protein
MRDVRQARIQMSEKFTNCLQEVQEMYQLQRSQREEALASHHLESVNRCRRAQRTNLSNAIAILVREADVCLPEILILKIFSSNGIHRQHWQRKSHF